ncbi:MAG: type II secretion system F family protein [Deltaproteobacteria bacterium]|nr:type II secretion system F family protein [Deltaproteobacteria bacterium]MBW2019927.1 type II secretion system F family protein [Deltaproteobacteria bacterium]MBW2074554.1 type II secretion system F family protein [Deltaproteobacteria bacterium]RLB81252.1 MAG: type II secretion system F family protein [Deltaproteobacteria bacterium]
MPVYLWKGKDRKGTVQKGEIEAPDESAVRMQLRRMQITPTKIKKKPKDLFENVSFMQPKVEQSDVVIFARQFSTMIDAGLPLIQGLEILYSQQENKTFKSMLKEIKESVEGGSTLADALKKYPKVFDDLFVNMIAAGEVGGILDTILSRLSAYMEKAMKLKKQVKGAMTYPIIVLIIAVLVVGVILVFVIPVFEKMFADFGGVLPVPTQIVVNMSRFVKGNIHYMIGAVVVFVFAFKRFYATEKGRALVDDIMLKLPVFGPLLRKVAVARFTRTTSTMISSGVSILDALDIVAKTAGNKTVEAAVYHVRSGITEGRTMADPLGETGVFPSMVVQMVAVGESTGALDTMLEKIADFYDDEVDAAVENLTSMIEPFMMVFLGVTIGGLVVSMYLPIFKMAGMVGG